MPQLSNFTGTAFSGKVFSLKNQSIDETKSQGEGISGKDKQSKSGEEVFSAKQTFGERLSALPPVMAGPLKPSPEFKMSFLIKLKQADLFQEKYEISNILHRNLFANYRWKYKFQVVYL